MFRTIGDGPLAWELLLPPEVLRLPAELARGDALLDDPVFFAPFAAYFHPVLGRPSIPVEWYLRLMFLKFRYRLGHLASYGFSVIGTTSEETGSGVEIGDAAHYLVAQAGTAGSVFYGNLDVSHVAAVGHSQGADGATRAALNNPALIKTLLTFSLPITYWLNGPSIAGLTRPAFLTSTHGSGTRSLLRP